MITVERLEEVFPGHGANVRAILDGDKSPEDYPAVAEWVRQCYHRPKLVELKMAAINAEIGGFGVEAIFGECEKWPDAEYVNMGDTYLTTILFDYTQNKYRITTWGDWIEQQELLGHHYE